jgi:hypothetical protein
MGNPPLYPLRWRGEAERGREGNDGDGAPGGRALPRLATWNVVKNRGQANDKRLGTPYTTRGQAVATTLRHGAFADGKPTPVSPPVEGSGGAGAGRKRRGRRARRSRPTPIRNRGQANDRRPRQSVVGAGCGNGDRAAGYLNDRHPALQSGAGIGN